MEKLKINFDISEDDKAINDMLEAYYNCPTAVKYLSQFNIPDETIKKQIAKIYSFVLDLNYCKNCPGCDKCKKENPCFITKITYESGSIDQTLVPCKEFTKKMAFEQQFLVKDFDDEWVKYALKDMDQNKERAVAVNEYLKYRKGLSNRWLFLNGGLNSGRSFVSALLTVDAAKNDLGPICYIDSTKRFKELNDLNFTNKDEFQNQINILSGCKILVLDDFGNEYKNDFIRDAIILDILQKRASQKLLTIFTSDFTINEIVELYSTSAAGKIRAKQLGNLIKKTCQNEINLGDLSIY